MNVVAARGKRELLQSLAGIMEKQQELMALLVSLGEEELAALRTGDIARLAQLTRQQEDAAMKLANLEKERVLVQTELAELLDIRPDATVKDIISSAGEGVEDLRRVTQLLRESHARLQELNETNRLLIKQSLGYVNRMLEALGARHVVYEQYGGAERQVGGSLAVDKSV